MKRALWAGLGIAVWGLAAGLLVARTTVLAGIVAAVLGASIGVLFAPRLAASRLRLPMLWLGGAALLLLVRSLSWLLVASALPSSLLGAGGAYALSEWVFWLCTTAVTVGVLQTGSRRVPALVTLEILAVGAVFATLLAAHRDGFINRPFALVDELWFRGWDPLPFFVATGVAATAVLALLAARSSSRRRSGRDVVLLLGLLVLLFMVLPIARLKDLPPFQRGGGQGGQRSQQSSDRDGKGGTGAISPGSSGGQGQIEAMTSFGNQARQTANQPVAVVVLHDDYDPQLGYYYLRQTAFSQYNGVRLVQDTSGLADQDLIDTFPSGRQTVAGDHPNAEYHSALETTVALIRPHPRPFALVNPTDIAAAANPDAQRFLRAYRVTSQVLTEPLPELAGLQVGSWRWTRAVRAHYTEGSRDPRFRALADAAVDLLKDEYRADPFAQAAAIQYWLGQSSVYSLTSDHDNSADPVADYLFGDRTGHCVFLAHSACLLFRARGIPSRVAAGYAVDARNRGGGSSLLIRERDAHAWPEVYLDGAGWVPMDISPAKSLVPPEEAPDQGLQQMLGEMARSQGGRPPLEEPPPGGGDLQEALRQAARTALNLALPLLALALVAAYAVKLWRRLAVHFCRQAELPRLAYRAALDRLAETGRWRGYGQPREVFARALAGELGSFDRLTTLHLAAALGRHHEATPRAVYLGLGRALAAEVALATPFLRRLLGALNPLAWMLVK